MYKSRCSNCGSIAFSGKPNDPQVKCYDCTKSPRTVEQKIRKNTKQMERIIGRRNSFIDSRGGCCERCGSIKELEVDHIDRSEKKYHPRQLWTRRESIMNEELAKCQVLCSRCHLEKTSSELREGREHGRNGYERGCKCDICRGHKKQGNDRRISINGKYFGYRRLNESIEDAISRIERERTYGRVV